MQNIKPLHGRVLIEAIDQINGIIMPTTSGGSLRLQRGRIKEIADGVRKLKVGDEVYFGASQTMLDLISFNGKEYFITEAHSVLAIVEESNDAGE